MIEENKWYDANYDKEIVKQRALAEEACFRLNNMSALDNDKRKEILERLIGKLGKEVTILSPFMVDYGNNCFIGDNCWIGADVTILPGVTIGQGSVIGAKSLVNKDIPANVVAVGNPCKVIREITEKDKI